MKNEEFDQRTEHWAYDLMFDVKIRDLEIRYGHGYKNVNKTKQAMFKISQKTTLHLQHTFFQNFFAVTSCLRRKCLILSFMEDVSKRRRNFISPSNLDIVLRNSTPGEFGYICLPE